MHIRCPHCQCPIELTAEASAEGEFLLPCPSCGSQLDLGGEVLPLNGELPRLVNHFELLERVGRGHFGDVWKAHDRSLDRIVAVKIPRTRDLDARTVELFLREARSAGRLRHPNIVPVHEAGRTDDLVYIVSEFIYGMPLSDYLAANRVPCRLAAQLCRTVAEALQHAHDAGVVHRDLKPGNIMIDAELEPHLMDFGLAKRDAGEMTMTIAGKILGTPAYMSPEQARGDGRQADRRSDVYSLGVILYEMLVGQRPFDGGKRLLLQRVLNDEPRPPRSSDRSIPRDLETICLKAMEKRPERRYATAREMGDDLSRFLRGEPIQARRAGAVERGWKWCRRNRSLAAAGMAAMAAFIFGAALFGSRGRSEAVVSGSAPTAPKTRTVYVSSDPRGARGVMVPVDPETGEPDVSRRIRFPGVTPVEVQAPPGRYVVVVDLQGHGFHEVSRVVPEWGEVISNSSIYEQWVIVGDQVRLGKIEIPKTERSAPGMALFAGGDFRAGSEEVPGSPVKECRLDPFWLDVTEVTRREYRAVMGRGTDPTKDEGLADDDAMAFVTFAEALAFAEMTGKRLPSEFEYEFAATNGGATRFPWGDDAAIIEPWRLGKVKAAAYDATRSKPPVYGLYSNVTEWTDSVLTSGAPGQPMPASLKAMFAVGRVVRGGPYEVIKGDVDLAKPKFGPRWRQGMLMMTSERGLGFRCARSAKPRFLD